MCIMSSREARMQNADRTVRRDIVVGNVTK